MELKGIDYIYTDREINDFADCVFGIDEDNYIFKYGAFYGYKDIKRYRYKEEFMHLLWKLNHINKNLQSDRYFINIPTLSEIEEYERERETLYATIKSKLNGEYSKCYSNVRSSVLPYELDTDEAKNLFKKAIDAGLLNDDYTTTEKTKTKTQKALLAEIISEKLGLKNKWKPFQELWNVEGLAQERYRSKELVGKVRGGEDIEKTFL